MHRLKAKRERRAIPSFDVLLGVVQSHARVIRSDAFVSFVRGNDQTEERVFGCFPIILSINASSRVSSSGFEKKPVAPAVLDLSRSSCVTYAVMKMTGTGCIHEPIASSNPNPSMHGM